MQMGLRSVPNPERGCGELKEGGCYARGDKSPFGTLQAWVWCLGEMVVGGQNLALSAPPRGMQVINLPLTLATGQLHQEPTPYVSPFPNPKDDPLAQLPTLALLDHVGSAHYTPAGFAAETAIHGASRRIPRDVAKIIAKHTPIPIVFTHSWMPVVDREYQTPLLEWAGADEATREWYTYTPTYTDKNWGLYSRNKTGDTHWGTGVMRKMKEAGKGKEVHLTEIMPGDLVENVLTIEQIFGISWISRCVYIATGNESDSDLDSLWGDNIEPVNKE